MPDAIEVYRELAREDGDCDKCNTKGKRIGLGLAIHHRVMLSHNPPYGVLAEAAFRLGAPYSCDDCGRVIVSRGGEGGGK